MTTLLEIIKNSQDKDADTLEQLAALVAQQAAVIEQMRSALMRIDELEDKNLKLRGELAEMRIALTRGTAACNHTDMKITLESLINQ